MGNYSYDDHVELFGGPPEPGEGVDWRDYVDQERKARKEDPPPEPIDLQREREVCAILADYAYGSRDAVWTSPATLVAEALRRYDRPGSEPAPEPARRPWWRRWGRNA